MNVQMAEKFKTAAMKCFTAPVIAAVLVFILFNLVMAGFFFTPNQGLGDDYAYFFPALLDSAYWLSQNSFFDIPWFSPAQCAGMPAFANPQNMFFAPVTFLSYGIGPRAGIYTVIVLSAVLGGYGIYGLARTIVKCSPLSAVIGAALFAMNGLFVERLLVGHFTYHAFMLIPLISYGVIGAAMSKRYRGAFGAACGFAYVVYAGGGVLLPVVGLGVTFLCLMLGWHLGLVMEVAKRWFLAAGIGAGLAGAKIVAAFYFLSGFERTYYGLPGFSSFADMGLFLAKSLFWQLSGADGSALIANSPRGFSAHDFALGVGPMVAVILILWAAGSLQKIITKQQQFAAVLKQPLVLTVLLAIAVLPILLNFYSPSWHTFIRSLPIISQSSNLFPWFGIYIAPLCLGAAIGLDQICANRRGAERMKLAVLALCLLWFYQQDRSVYQTQRYNPEAIEKAFDQLHATGEVVAINRVGAYVNQQGQPVMTLQGNGAMTIGVSQRLCYEPIFGYRLEKFPVGDLRSGPITANYFKDNLNFKNPICYAYGKANNCQSGDPFKISEAGILDRLAHYALIPFEMPGLQKLANGLSLVTLIAVLMGIFWPRKN